MSEVVEKIVGLPYHKVREGVVYNDCPQLFAKVPEMNETEKFRVTDYHWTPVRIREGGKEDGTPFLSKSLGTFNFSCEFIVNDNESGRSYRVCAFRDTKEGEPIPLQRQFNGDENGIITLHKSNFEDRQVWFAFMLNPRCKDNILGARNSNNQPYDIERIDEVAKINARATFIESRKAAERALDEIKDLDILYALSQQLNINAPYLGTKAVQPLMVYLDGFIQANPNSVIDAIQDLDAIKIRQQIDDAITLGVLINEQSALGWYFPKSKGNKGLINYAEGTETKGQKTALVNHLLSQKGLGDKLLMQKELEKAIKSSTTGE